MRFFNLVTNDLQDEQNFRLFLSDLESSMSAPFGGPGANAGAIPGAAFYDVISDLTNHADLDVELLQRPVQCAVFAAGDHQQCLYLGQLPRHNFGRVVHRVDGDEPGKGFLKHPLDAQLNLPGVAFTVLSSPTNN